jgi:DNA polymerase-3 subunit delta
MITVLTGENSFEIERALRALTTTFGSESETIEGSNLTRAALPDLLMGATLFTDKRLVVIKNLSENKTLWTEFGDWLERISDDIHLVLIDTKPDKRTKTYKDLQKVADIHEYKVWGERDVALAEKWVVHEAQTLGRELDKKLAHFLVRRVGVDQWRLYNALQKLVLLDEITILVIEDIIEANPSESVFNVFEAALQGDVDRVRDMIAVFELSEDPFRLFGLLSGQAFQLAVLAVTDKPAGEVAKDIGAHPFALGKLAPYAKKLSRADARKIIEAFSEADEAMKTSAAEPWLLIERALAKVVARSTI